MGETREYPFQFGALYGPLTYHGHLLQVDWYLHAKADIPLAMDVETREEFWLVAGETAEKILLGSKEDLDALNWFIRAQIAIREWPDWVQEFPIVVIP